MGLEIKKYRKLFAKLDEPQPPADLAYRTLQAIAARERKILIAKLVGLGITFTLSVAFVATELTAAGNQIASSGFLQFVSLFFSDFSLVAHNLPDVLFSVAESFPMFSAGLALGGLVVAVWSFAGFVDDANIMRNRAWLVK